MIRNAVKTLLITCLLASPAMAQPLAKELFGAKSQGSNQRAAPHGGYAKGCMAGGVRLPETGPTWQAMRLSRNRNWGHPETIDYIEKLSAFAAKQKGWKGLKRFAHPTESQHAVILKHQFQLIG